MKTNMKSTKNMKAVAVALLVAGTFAVAPCAQAGNASITDVKMQQRYPWNGLVDIEYTATGIIEAAETVGLKIPAKVTVVAIDKTTHVTNVADAACLSGDASYSNGTHTIVWDMDKQGLTQMVANNAVIEVLCDVVNGEDYATLQNRPTINGVLVNGAKTSADYKIFAPTSVGSSGNILQSNGSGAPLWVDIFDIVYPVGSVYISVGSTLPTVFSQNGRTWVKLSDGQFLMNTTGTTGTTGGSNSRTLTTANMPAHSHSGNTLTPNVATFGGFGMSDTLSGNIFTYKHWWYASTASSANTSYGGWTMNTSGKWTGATSTVGSGTAFDNRPSYLAVSMWKRTK